jgi:anti-sigma factor RsiW
MRYQDDHLSDAQLVGIADWEVIGREARRLEEHLSACWHCRARRAELERTIADYVRLHDDASQKMPPMEESRARLLAKLIQLSATPAVSVSPRRFGKFAYGSVAACLILAAGVVLYLNVLKAGAAPVPNGA